MDRVLFRKLVIHAVEYVLLVPFRMNHQEFGWVEKTARVQAIRRDGTGFIYRPNEYGGGPAGVADEAKPGDFDVVSTSIIDLAQQMGT